MAGLIRFRASSAADFLTCPRLWAARQLEGRDGPAGSAAQLGTAVHAGTAWYDQQRMLGLPATIEEAAGIAVHALYHPTEEIDWGAESPASLESTARALTRLYCLQIAPRLSFEQIELTCASCDMPRYGVTLTGTTDRVYRDSLGRLGIADIKTGKYVVGTDGVVQTGKYRAQLGIYELLAARSLQMPIQAPALILGLHAAKTDRGRRCGIGVAGNALTAVTGPGGLLERVGRALADGVFPCTPDDFRRCRKWCPVAHVCFAYRLPVSMQVTARRPVQSQPFCAQASSAAPRPTQAARVRTAASQPVAQPGPQTSAQDTRREEPQTVSPYGQNTGSWTSFEIILAVLVLLFLLSKCS